MAKTQKFDKVGKKVYNRKVSFFRKGETDILWIEQRN